MELQRIFISNMKKWRKTAGLSQEKLAIKCDTAHNYIRQIEAGLRCPSFVFIEKIAAALEVAPFQLFFDESYFEAAGPHHNRLKEAEKTLLEGVSAQIRAVFGVLY
jgi:transcriptional regulator with XRE-family HTH domain